MTRMRIAAVVAVACLLVGGLTVANAALLSVDGGSLSTATASRCTAQNVTFVRQRFFVWWSSADVTIPSGCEGKPVEATARCTGLFCGGASHTYASHDGGSGTVRLYFDETTTSSTVWLTIDGWTVPVQVE